MARGRIEATPDCPQFQGTLPDRNGDWGLAGLNNQNTTRREKKGAGAQHAGAPLVYRPPVGQFIPQTGIGSEEKRFTDRTYLKGETAQAPNFKVKGSSPMRKGGSHKVTLTKFPEYKEDPWDEKVKKMREDMAAQRAKMSDTKPFKPTRGDQQYTMTRGAKPAFANLGSKSIIFHVPGRSGAGR